MIRGHLDRFQLLIRSLLLFVLLLDVNSFIIYIDPDCLTSAVNALFGDGRTVRLHWPSWIIFSSGVQRLSQVKLALFFFFFFAIYVYLNDEEEFQLFTVKIWKVTVLFLSIVVFI